MKVTCSDVNALEACLVRYQFDYTSIQQVILEKYLQPGADVDITARDFGSSEEGMTTVPSSACNLDRIAATVRFGGIERYYATLVAVGSVSRPSCLVPAAFEVVGDLSQRQRKQGESGEAERAEHDHKWKMGSEWREFEICVLDTPRTARSPTHLIDNTLGGPAVDRSP